MKIDRRYTTSEESPYASFKITKRQSEIRNPDGTVVFQQDDISVPEDWSQVATDVLAQKYFRKAGVPQVDDQGEPILDDQGKPVLGGEVDCRQTFGRLAGCWTHWGYENGYFDSSEDARSFHDELCYMLAAQMCAPNSPQWFNTGLHWAYGIDGPAQGHQYVDPSSGEVTAATSAYQRPQPHACFIQSVKDDLVGEGGIMDLWTREARLFKYGSGTGSNFSSLRGEGEALSGGGKSSGLMSFLKIGDAAAGAIKSGGTTRRAAKMVCLDLDHPDIEDFITIKNDANRTKVQHANISVLITHEFMNAVLEDADFDLRWGGEVYRTIRARELWNKIITNAHASAEPGIIFWDTMREYHNVEYANKLTSTNPCGEQPLASYTACNLGNLNLVQFVREDGSFDYEDLAESSAVATRFLDDVIEYNMDNHAMPKIRDAVASDRRVGLGLTGLADALVLMSLRYDSDEALEVVEKIMQTICYYAYETSIELAREKGAFPLFEWEGLSQSKFIQGLPEGIRERIQEHGLRNSTLITMPPVGTGSIVAQTASGIEPIFCTSYRRRVKQADGESFREYKVYHPLVKRVFGGDENLPDYVVTSHDIDPYFRVKMQGVIQKYTDSSISSTINLAEDTTVETVADIYITAYKEGLKGVTVYREGSRQGILQTGMSDGEAPAAKDAGSAVVGLNGEGSGDPGANTADVDHSTGFHPRLRPAVTQGVTERIRTGEGNIYITINEDEQGLCEVFSTIGKAGGNAAAQCEAISRLISLALRSSINPLEIVKMLKGISGPTPVWENGELILSTPDAIGRAIERYLARRGDGPKVSPVDAHHHAAPATASVSSSGGSPPAASQAVVNSVTCPECGSTVVHESNCLTCKHCGWSKC